MNPVMTARLVDLERQIAAAPRGEKTRLREQAAKELGVSIQTLYRKTEKVTGKAPRKRRADAGTSALSEDEAKAIGAALRAATRKNGKRLASIQDAVDMLRANKMIDAERVDPETGEIFELSTSAVLRALRAYGYHPDQLDRPDPVTELKSLHPNHVWQIDASLCVLYYLKPEADPHKNGLRVMPHDEFYKNKPRNLERIAADRVWSYEITDHASGWIYVQYVMGAESGWNLCNVLIDAMQERGGRDVLHGVPQILMMDPGSANTAGMTRNLCRELGIRMIAHAPGAARVTGQVEKARDIIEKSFEAGLSFASVRDLADLNAKAAQWRAWFNSTRIHRRHGQARSAMWLTIREEQLVKAPPLAICRELAVAEPDSRKVTPKLRVSFRGQEYDVAKVPGVSVGDNVMVTINPWRDDAAQVVEIGADGGRIVHVVPRIATDDLGFATGAAVIGEEHKTHAETPAQQKRREVNRLAWGEAEAPRKGRALPFEGKLNPWKIIEEGQNQPDYMPRRGTPHPVAAPEVVTPPLNHIEAAKQLRPRIPAWGPEHLAWLKEKFPGGVPAGELEAVVNHFSHPAAGTPMLRVVGG